MCKVPKKQSWLVILALVCICGVRSWQRYEGHSIGIERRLIRQGNSGGRGVDHISAEIEEGDLVLYQSGRWLVDGVEVGSGSEARLACASVLATQLVFTATCEHGQIIGSPVELSRDYQVSFFETEEEVQFGPEQVLARLQTIENADGTKRLDASSLELLSRLECSEQFVFSGEVL